MPTIEICPGSFIDIHREWLPDPDPLFQELMSSIQWQQRTVKIFGREIPQPRLTAWYGSAPYTYSGTRNDPLQVTPTLMRLMAEVKRETDECVNSVLCNLYRNGNDSVGMHADDEPELGKEPVIASLSLGATRSFDLVPNDGRKKVRFELASGDLLVMRGKTQGTHKHGVPKQPSVTEPRINLTFRMIRRTAMTNVPTPPLCNSDIFNYGQCVFVTHSIPSHAMEGWVRKVAAASGQQVDWCVSRGKQMVRALGDLTKVHEALVELKPEHDDLWFKTVSEGRPLGDLATEELYIPTGFMAGLTVSSGYAEVPRVPKELSRFDLIG